MVEKVTSGIKNFFIGNLYTPKEDDFEKKGYLTPN